MRDKRRFRRIEWPSEKIPHDVSERVWGWRRWPSRRDGLSDVPLPRLRHREHSFEYCLIEHISKLTRVSMEDSQFRRTNVEALTVIVALLFIAIEEEHLRRC